MKNVIVFLFLIGLLVSCSKDEEPNDTGLIGKWELIEVLNDPGDGSGDFMVVDSDKTIEFFEDGTVTSNGSLCFNGIDTDMASSGTYSIDEQTINAEGCTHGDRLTHFELDGDILIISYLCIEPCQAKYKKLP